MLAKYDKIFNISKKLFLLKNMYYSKKEKIYIVNVLIIRLIKFIICSAAKLCLHFMLTFSLHNFIKFFKNNKKVIIINNLQEIS